MRIYDTLTRAVQDLQTRREGEVAMYVCGPTVQAAPHVGHGRSAVAFDVIRRYLVWRGYQVTFVRNITDVEDKIIAAAAETGESPLDLADRVAASFAESFEALGVLPPDVEPKATEHIPEMLDLIRRLVERGLAYAADGDVYFSVRAFERYGRLSGQRPDDLRAGARIEVSELKADPLDFALWKAAKPGEPWWDSPWGPGRPGWHIECSAMASKYLGDGFDIHGGGTDLIFPHHENEIAQSEGMAGSFAHYWMHNGMVNLSGEKMAKSTGVLVDLAEVINRYGGMAVRLFYLRAHYRSPLEYSEQLLEDAAESYRRLDALRRRVPKPEVDSHPDVSAAFRDAMDDDFGTPQAVALLFETLREANRIVDEGGEAGSKVAAVYEIASVLGLERVESVRVGDVGEIDGIVAQRAAARAAQDYETADRLRAELDEKGIVVEDTPDGPRWYRRQG
jgi:cysteinyl-tRNA synthetase